MEWFEAVERILEAPEGKLLLVLIMALVVGSAVIVVIVLRHAGRLSDGLIELNRMANQSAVKNSDRLADSEERQAHAMESLLEIVQHVSYQTDLMRQAVTGVGDAIGRNTSQLEDIATQQSAGFNDLTELVTVQFSDVETTLLQELAALKTQVVDLGVTVQDALTTPEQVDNLTAQIKQLNNKIDCLVEMLGKTIDGAIEHKKAA